jgi:hypothetical protein
VTTVDQASPRDVKVLSNSPPKTGVWTHLVATCDAAAGVATLYVDVVCHEHGTT